MTARIPPLPTEGFTLTLPEFALWLAAAACLGGCIALIFHRRSVG